MTPLPDTYLYIITYICLCCTTTCGDVLRFKRSQALPAGNGGGVKPQNEEGVDVDGDDGNDVTLMTMRMVMTMMMMMMMRLSSSLP